MSDIDLTFVAYMSLRVVLAYCFLLFFLWYIIVRKGKGTVSVIYVIVMLLFAARFHAISLAMKIRSLRFGDPDVYRAWLDGFLWDTRVLPEAILFIVLAVILTRKFILSYMFHQTSYRQEKGRRLSDKE